jgi:hypothetical protein
VIRVAGERYDTPEAAFAAADELERQAEAETGESTPARRSIEGHVAAIRAAARKAQEREAARTSQPPDAPGGRGGRRRSRGASGSRRRPAFTPPLAGAYRRTGIPGALTSTTTLALQAAGMTIAIAALVLLLANRRGPQAFAELANALAGAVGWIVDPVDPLAPRPQVTAPPPARSTSSPPATRATVATYGYGRGG